MLRSPSGLVSTTITLYFPSSVGTGISKPVPLLTTFPFSSLISHVTVESGILFVAVIFSGLKGLSTVTVAFGWRISNLATAILVSPSGLVSVTATVYFPSSSGTGISKPVPLLMTFPVSSFISHVTVESGILFVAVIFSGLKGLSTVTVASG